MMLKAVQNSQLSASNLKVAKQGYSFYDKGNTKSLIKQMMFHKQKALQLQGE